MTVTVRRTGALGDVLCITPILMRLRRDHPAVKIVVETAHPIAVASGPWMEAQRSANGKGLTNDLYIDCDLAYERQPTLHVVDAYFQHVFHEDAPAEDKSLYFDSGRTWKTENIAVIHAARSWASRTMSNAFWDAVAVHVKSLGLRPVFVGGAGDYGGPLWATNSLTKLHLRQVAALIEGAVIFIGSDSALIHLAGTTVSTPIVGLYTSVRAKYRMPYRHGELGWNMIGLEPGIVCQGCLERKIAPVTNMTCDRGDNICTRSILHVDVLAAVKELTGRDLVKKHPGIVMPSRPSANL